MYMTIAVSSCGLALGLTGYKTVEAKKKKEGKKTFLTDFHKSPTFLKTYLTQSLQQSVNNVLLVQHLTLHSRSFLSLLVAVSVVGTDSFKHFMHSFFDDPSFPIGAPRSLSLLLAHMLTGEREIPTQDDLFS